MTKQEKLTNIKRYLAKAKLKEAVDALLDYTTLHFPSQEQAIIALSSKYYKVEEMARNTTISMTDYQRTHSQLIISILDKVASFEVEMEEKVSNISLESFKETYKLSIARTSVLAVLMKAIAGMSIKEIHQATGLQNRKYIIVVLNELITFEMVERYPENDVSLNRLTPKGKLMGSNGLLN